MLLAVPQYNGRVSPVFDVAGRLVLVDVVEGRETGRREVALRPSAPSARAGELADLHADVLVCGAISRELEVALVAGGIRVISRAVGPVDGVIEAFLDGRLDGDHLGFEDPDGTGRRGSMSAARRAEEARASGRGGTSDRRRRGSRS